MTDGVERSQQRLVNELMWGPSCPLCGVSWEQHEEATCDNKMRKWCPTGLGGQGTTMVETVALITLQVERPDGTLIYQLTIPTYLCVYPMFAAETDGTLYIGSDQISPPWLVKARVGQEGEWETLHDQR